MTLGGLILRFSVAYLLALVCGLLMAFYFTRASTLVITTAALAASTLYVCQLFRRRNGRSLGGREMAVAWLAFLLIDVALQVLSRLTLVGTDAAGLERLRQFVAGDLIFITVLHGFCILAFMVMAGRVKDKQRG